MTKEFGWTKNQLIAFGWMGGKENASLRNVKVETSKLITILETASTHTICKRLVCNRSNVGTLPLKGDEKRGTREGFNRAGALINSRWSQLKY